MKTLDAIRLRGVRQNNLKGFDLDIPLGKVTVVTGLSGSGKSSLVFDTLHAEGQRRYVETFSPYTRQFLEMLRRPEVDSIENIRPSIAIEQKNSVKTSRSTVGTMTELTDFFKVWFSARAQLFDPETGELVEDDNPQSIWKKSLQAYRDQRVQVAFRITRPGKLKWAEILDALRSQGFQRLVMEGKPVRLDDLEPAKLAADAALFSIQDRLKMAANQKKRFIEAAETALHFGHGHLWLLDEQNQPLAQFSQGLHSPATGRDFRPPSPALFSFNSPVGACPQCRGFGRVIETDDNLILPDHSLSINAGAIKPFSGAVYSESLRDLQRAARRHGVRTDIPWREMSEADKRFVMEGEPGYEENGADWQRHWYGVRRFFSWLETQTYKMHVRIFLSRFRAYVRCPACDGARLQPESLCWRWQGRTLPELYKLPIRKLLPLLEDKAERTGDRQADTALDSILSRLRYLREAGLEYLSLDRSSRSLSGGEVERVNLTTCLGTMLTDALFVLDEPSVGLHARDIDRLIGILRSLAENGNTVVVVEHDEAIIRAADHLVELGPQAGSNGGNLVYSGDQRGIRQCPDSLTGSYLSGARTIVLPESRRPVKLSRQKSRIRKTDTPALRLNKVTCHNLDKLDVVIPLQRFVCLSGVSGSGKSTLLNNAIYQLLCRERGKATSSAAQAQGVRCELDFAEIELVDQSPVTKTPRSNPALYTDAWDGIRQLYGSSEAAKQAGLTAAHFSFNSGQGRCDHCQGLGYERIEMQFLSDVFVPCPVCEGKRFKQEVLDVRWQGKNVDEVLAMDLQSALTFFDRQAKIQSRLKTLCAVGLGYLTLGQPLNTLSGGESQRLKLAKYLARLGEDEAPSLLLLDEPTTGLHRHDVRTLLEVLQTLVNAGHSLILIEHNLDVLKSADYLIELGPEAGELGGKIVAEGSPESIAKAKTHTAPFMREALADRSDFSDTLETFPDAEETSLEVAEAPVPFGDPEEKASPTEALTLVGAREHNLKNLSLSLPRGEFTVVTGVSGSGKSSLAFDIIFAEGQRRFIESISPYARQFVEQLPRPDIDRLSGIAPTVAIEQRVTRGTRKSTVATITEVAQYLRLLYARVGVQHSIHTGEPLQAATPDALLSHLQKKLKAPEVQKAKHAWLCAPLIRGRKGHHQPLANWAADHGYERLFIDGEIVLVEKFKKLDRYREHDIALITTDLKTVRGAKDQRAALEEALRIGKGSAFVLLPPDAVALHMSTTRTDPVSGEAYPELDPKHFSWNSPRGWCPACHGYGSIEDWMAEDENFEELPDDAESGQPCPECDGERLNPQARAVYLYQNNGYKINLPQLLRMTSVELMQTVEKLKLDKRQQQIVSDILPQIHERLAFMEEVGLGYLTLDRATVTLSGGEAQRIRLAAQLGSNLSGVLYVLDEPSIGLHARDNQRLLTSLARLKAQGNSLLVVEHDDETMRAADRILDLGPGAGAHGGELLASGHYREILGNKDSLTARYLKNPIPHPLLGERKSLPAAWHPRRKQQDWLVLKKCSLRNLKGHDLHLPLGRLIGVCGISGAGKSTLIRDLLHPAVNEAINRKTDKLLGKDSETFAPMEKPPFVELRNGNAFRSVIEVDQEPIGKTPRSSPATYMGAFDLIRDLYAQLPEARMRGLSASTFSFNTKGGRCETCKGAGRVKLEMNFLPNAWVPCEDCGGGRFSDELADVTYRGKTIADALAMSFEEAAEFFGTFERLSAMLGLMVETGLGYLTLGQSSPTLSGGEAQRLKLVTELAKGLPTWKDKNLGRQRRNLYLLEEPTIGLHMADVEKLLRLLHRLSEQGHTVVVIEHHLDMLADADYLVEIGPDGGAAGGRILFQGTPEALAKKDTPTAPFLKQTLEVHQ